MQVLFSLCVFERKDTLGTHSAGYFMIQKSFPTSCAVVILTPSLPRCYLREEKKKHSESVRFENT